ncbi:MAG: hypothetical protein M3O71_02890 [Bacteroidota bacterium]|nr:hypothetical protein [Bacteroidota bacterium]
MKKIIYSSLFFMQLLLLNLVVNAQDVGQLAKQKPFEITGTAGIGFGTYSATGIEDRERSFSYLFNGAPVISIYGVSFPFSIVVSDQQRGFRQPFNQYGISPTYKWLTIHAGWQSITWSPFTLAGYDFLGGGIEAHPGKLRLGFVYGRFNKAIATDTANHSLFQTTAYKRNGYAARAGYGTESNHLDFTYLSAKDEVNSLPQYLVARMTPASNIVLGISSKWSFLHHFTWTFDVAGSLYTRNLLSDTLGSLELEKANFIKKLIAVNSSTQFFTAAQTQVAYQNKNYNLGLQYRRIDPDYKSMGAYYFETDVANYTVNGGISLLQNKVQVNGSFGLQNDNLLHDREFTSHRSINSLMLSYNMPQYGASINYSNYGITQDRGLNPLVDTFRVARTNYNFNGILRYTINADSLSHTFILVGNIQSLVDLNHFTASQNEANSKTANLSYQLGFLKTGFSINAAYSYTVADLPLMHTVLTGPTFGINKLLDKGKLNLSANIGFQQQQNSGLDAGTVINGILNGSYRVSKRDALNLSLMYLKSKSKNQTLPSFNEKRSLFNITHAF